MPLGRDPVRGGAKLTEEVAEQLTDRLGPFGTTAVGDEHARVRRHQRHAGIDVKPVDCVEEPLDRRLAHGSEF